MKKYLCKIIIQYDNDELVTRRVILNQTVADRLLEIQMRVGLFGTSETKAILFCIQNSMYNKNALIVHVVRDGNCRLLEVCRQQAAVAVGKTHLVQVDNILMSRIPVQNYKIAAQCLDFGRKPTRSAFLVGTIDVSLHM